MDVARFEAANLFSQPGLYLFIPIILLQIIGSLFFRTGAFETPLLLTPGVAAIMSANTLTILLCLLLLFYTVESVLREKNSGLSPISYTTPSSTAATLFGKALANGIIAVVIMIAALIGAVVVILIQGKVVPDLMPFVIVWGGLLVPTFLVWSSFVMALLATTGSRYLTYALALGHHDPHVLVPVPQQDQLGRELGHLERADLDRFRCRLRRTLSERQGAAPQSSVRSGSDGALHRVDHARVPPPGVRLRRHRGSAAPAIARPSGASTASVHRGADRDRILPERAGAERIPRQDRRAAREGILGTQSRHLGGRGHAPLGRRGHRSHAGSQAQCVQSARHVSLGELDGEADAALPHVGGRSLREHRVDPGRGECPSGRARTSVRVPAEDTARAWRHHRCGLFARRPSAPRNHQERPRDVGVHPGGRRGAHRRSRPRSCPFRSTSRNAA